MAAAASTAGPSSPTAPLGFNANHSLSLLQATFGRRAAAVRAAGASASTASNPLHGNSSLTVLRADGRKVPAAEMAQGKVRGERGLSLLPRFLHGRLWARVCVTSLGVVDALASSRLPAAPLSQQRVVSIMRRQRRGAQLHTLPPLSLEPSAPVPR